MDHEPPPRSSRLPIGLRLALLVGVVAFVLVAVASALPFSRELIHRADSSVDCTGMTEGYVDYSAAAERTWKRTAEDGPPVVTITYVTRDGFMDFSGVPHSTAPVRRDVVDPPLGDGDPVSFRGSGDDLEVTRDC